MSAAFHRVSGLARGETREALQHISVQLCTTALTALQGRENTKTRQKRIFGVLITNTPTVFEVWR